IALMEFPQFDAKQVDEQAEYEMNSLQLLVYRIREQRILSGRQPSEKVAISVYPRVIGVPAFGMRAGITHADLAQQHWRNLLAEKRPAIERLANCSISIATEMPLEIGTCGPTEPYFFNVPRLAVDPEAEKQRLEKEYQKYLSELEGKRRQLSNAGF